MDGTDDGDDGGDERLSRLRRRSAVWPLAAGGALTAAAVGFVELLSLALPGARIMHLLVPPVTLLTGVVCWWVVQRRCGVTPRTGALAGGLTGLLSHPVVWAGTWLLDAVTGSGDPLSPQYWVNGVEFVAFVSLLGLAMFGWLSIPVGGLVGAGVGYLQAGGRSDGGDAQ